jgi:hypothetical protein
MGAVVPVEVAARSKGLVALGACKGLLSRMDPEVLGKVAARLERLVALGTRKRLLSRVNTEVLG